MDNPEEVNAFYRGISTKAGALDSVMIGAVIGLQHLVLVQAKLAQLTERQDPEGAAKLMHMCDHAIGNVMLALNFLASCSTGMKRAGMFDRGFRGERNFEQLLDYALQVQSTAQEMTGGFDGPDGAARSASMAFAAEYLNQMNRRVAGGNNFG